MNVQRFSPASFLLLAATLWMAPREAIAQTVSPADKPAQPQVSANPSSAATDTSNQDFPKEAFVTEQLHSIVRFENDGTGSRDSVFRIRIQSEAGVQRWGQLRFAYNSANDHLEIPYVRVLKQDGSIVKATGDSVQDLSAPVQQIAPVYTDYREKHVTVPSLRPGDILEFESITVVHTALAPGQFWMQYDFDQTNIVLNEQLAINVPAGREVKVKTKPGLDEPKITEEKGRRVYHWTSSHLVREEDTRNKDKDKDKRHKKKTKADEIPSVQLTTFGSWEEVGRWYAGLEKDRRQPSKEIRSKADELTKGLTTEMDKTEALYDFVAKNFRYVSLSLGMARYQPQPASDVLRNQYGDCKDKKTLLAALLEAEGLHSSSVLINPVRKLDADVPSPSQFSHVITMLSLGKEEVWMDTTTEVAPFRLLASSLRKKQALVIPPGGAPHLEETPVDPGVPDVERLEIQAKVGDSGRLEAKVTFIERGDTELLMRTIFRRISTAQWQTAVEGINKKTLGGDVSNVKVSDPTATREPFTISYEVSKVNFVDWSKKKVELKLPLAQINPVAVSADVDEDLEDTTDAGGEPFKIGPVNEHSYKIKLELASRYTAQPPVAVAVNRDYASYQSAYDLNNNMLTAERKLIVRQGELPPSRADDYRAFRQTVLADDAQFVTIESAVADTHTIPEGMKSADFVKSGNEARQNGNYGLAIDLLNRAVEADPKSKIAWNDLGIVYMDNHQDELAINAFQKQIEINPYHRNAYDNLGRVYLRERKYDEAQKWFLKQIEIDPLHQHAHANLGTAYLEQHKYLEAVPILEKAAALAPDNANSQVALGEAYLNLEQDEKATAAFDKAIKLSATPQIWNAIAYQLALKKVHLDRARSYAESAVSATAADLRNVSLEQINKRDPGRTNNLAAFWDTLGWVAFAEGNFEIAERYVFAAWQLGNESDEADHLGQIYERRGKKEDAVRFYALAMNARRPDPETRIRLATLLGGQDKADATVEKYRDESQHDRTIKFANPAKLDGKADFFVLLSTGSGAVARVEGVAFVDGDEKLKPASDALRAAHYDQKFPDDSAVKVLRRGTLSCKTNDDCSFQLMLPSDVRTLD
jgi:tetratricopeptide (TPR) repeat protein